MDTRETFFKSPAQIEEDFFIAVQEGNLDKVKEDWKKMQGKKDAQGLSTLHLAAKFGHQKIIKFLLVEGVDIEEKSAGYRALHFAASYGNKAVVELLLDAGADVNATNIKGGVYWLKIASPDNESQHHAQIFKGQTALHLAANSRSLDIVELLLARSAKVNIYDGNGFTPLYAAVFYNQIEMAQLLIEHGADVNEVNEYCGERSLLHEAAENNYFEIVQVLVEYGANINAQDRYGKTPLHTAIEEEHLEVAKYLYDKKANINIKDCQGKTALQLSGKTSYDDLFSAVNQNIRLNCHLL